MGVSEAATRNSHHEVTKDTKKVRVIRKLHALRAFVVQQLFLLRLLLCKARLFLPHYISDAPELALPTISE